MRAVARSWGLVSVFYLVFVCLVISCLDIRFVATTSAMALVMPLLVRHVFPPEHPYVDLLAPAMSYDRLNDGERRVLAFTVRQQQARWWIPWVCGGIVAGIAMLSQFLAPDAPVRAIDIGPLPFGADVLRHVVNAVLNASVIVACGSVLGALPAGMLTSFWHTRVILVEWEAVEREPPMGETEFQRLYGRRGGAAAP